MTDEEIKELVQKMSDEFDRLFIIASKAQFKKSEEITKEESEAIKLINETFSNKEKSINLDNLLEKCMKK